MNYRISFIALLLTLAVCPLYAQELKSDSSRHIHNVELRMKAEFNKTWKGKYSLGINEEIRTILGGNYTMEETAYEAGKIVNTTPSYTGKVPASFSKSYTTISFSYNPIDYFALGGGYTLKLYGDKGWDDPNEFIRHRVFFYLTPQIKINQWKLSLRERLDIDMRTDSVNPNEKKNTELSLRSRLRVDYTMPNKPLRFHLMTEIFNTLNVPVDYLNTYAVGQNIRHYGQYVSYVRPEFGVRWRLDRTNYLHFYYQFAYHYERDINITKKAANVELVHKSTYKHIIGITYEFGW